MSTKKAVVSSDTYRTLRPILYLGRIFSLCPVAASKLGPNHYVIKKSTAYVVYGCSFALFISKFEYQLLMTKHPKNLVLQVGTAGYGLWATHRIDVVYKIRWRENTDRYVTISDICVILLSCLLSVTITTLKIDKFLDYLNCLNKIDSLLAKYPDKPKKYFLVSVATLVITIIVLGFDLCLWMRISLKDQSEFVGLLAEFLPFYFSYIYIIIIELIYWHLVHSIKIRIIALNRDLDEMDFNQIAIKQTKKIDRRNINNIIDCLSTARHLQEAELKTKCITTTRIRNFIMIYEKILEAVNTVNDFYGFIILIIILGCLVHLLVTPYGLYSMISTTGDSIFILSQTIWMFGHVLRLALIIEPCHDCAHHIKSTIQTVCRLMSSELPNEAKKILQTFALHLSRCKIEFTAFDMTTVNRALLTTIAGAVTTYLVILFQFNNN